MNHTLSRQGFILKKTKENLEEISRVKSELTVKPYQPFSFGKKEEEPPYPVYLEDDENIYLPRFYALEKYGKPKKTKKWNNQDVKITFKGNLRDYQNNIINQSLPKIKETGGGMISLRCGGGKCLGKGTEILMFDGTIKKVEDVVVGDLLMGDDSTPRKVLTLARGREMMYRIKERNSKNSYQVNQSHILSLKDKENKIHDICVEDYLNLSLEEREKLNGYRVKIENHHLKINPELKGFNLEYKINLEKLQEDDYYGFEIDGNRRFVLSDFTVTHNTVLALYLACQLKKKTLIMVHKTFLLNQWIERIEQFTDAKVGIIMQDKVEVDGKDIVIGMLQSISKDKYDEKLFQQFGLVIFDEAHHAPSRFFSRSLPMIASEYCLALSATPKRSDKLEKIIFWYMGNIVYQEADNIKRDVLVKMYHYKSDNKKFREAKLPYTGEPNLPRTINWITELESRNKLIIDLIEEIIQEDNRHILVLSDRIKHLEELKKLLDERKITESDFYIGKMKQKDLDLAKDKPVLFGSYAMASEALDIPTLNCLVMTTSRRNIEQSVGRILRTQNSNIQPLIIDFNDELNCFQTQGRGRIKFYQKNDYKIMKILTKEDKILEERELGKQIFPDKINLDEVDFID